jgi:ribose-phosphate pyrophosphokinase
VIPFYAYGRSDKKDQPRVPITARLIADMITVAGADRVLTMDLHQGQIQGFFNIPVDELTAVHMLSNYFLHKHLEDTVVVTDLGFAKRARAFAEALDAPLAVIEKRRIGNLDRAELMNVIGDVRGGGRSSSTTRSTPRGTLIEIVRALEREGVTEIYACATHGVLSDPAIERIRESALREVVLTDTVPLPPAKRISQITTISIAPLVGEAIKRIHRGESVGRCSAARSRSPRRCCSGRTASRGRSIRGPTSRPPRATRPTTTRSLPAELASAFRESDR